MQHIQDKDFDAQIRNQFEDAELPVSSASWGHLEKRLYPVSNKRNKAWWMAAASIFLIAGFGLYFNQKQVPSARHIAVLRPSVELPAIDNAGVVVVESGAAKGQYEATELSYLQAEKAQAERGVHEPLEGDIAVLAESDYPQVDNLIQARKEIILSALQPTADLARLQDRERLAGPARLSPAADITHSDQVFEDLHDQSPNVGINNIGDLVNYVVQKVDKRADKMLEFKTDDDNSSLIAINIGLLKFGRKKDN